MVVDTLPYITSVDGGVSESSESEDGGESMLDLSIAYSLMYPQKINYIDVDDTYYQDNYYYDGFGDTLLDALDGVCDFCTTIAPPWLTSLLVLLYIFRFWPKGKQQQRYNSLFLTLQSCYSSLIPMLQSTLYILIHTKVVIPVRLNVVLTLRQRSFLSRMDQARTSGPLTMSAGNVMR